MIARYWRGRTTAENADAYESLLRGTVLPGIGLVPGYRGASVLRRDLPDGVEFVTLTRFDSYDAIRAFAGDDPEAAVVPPAARALLAAFDDRAVHYQIAVEAD